MWLVTTVLNSTGVSRVQVQALCLPHFILSRGPSTVDFSMFFTDKLFYGELCPPLKEGEGWRYPIHV